VSHVVESYVYRDASGNPVRLDRIEPGFSGRRKEFLPFASSGNGAFNQRPGLNGAQLRLYRDDEVRSAITGGQTVFFTEGEGKGDRLRAALRDAGDAAAVTTIQGGANASLGPDHLDCLAGARCVVVLADSGEPGRNAASSRAQRVAEAGVADVRLIDFYEARTDGSDIADWIAEGHAVDELRGLVERARRFEASGRIETPTSAWVNIGSLLAEPDEVLRWLVNGLLLLGGTSLLVSKPKVGKSTLVRDLALCVGCGLRFLGREVTPGAVLYVALEDKRAELRRAFRAMGAGDDDPIEFYIARAPEDALEWLRQKAEQRRPKLIAIDTFQRFARLQDLNDYAQVTNALDPVDTPSSRLWSPLAAHASREKIGRQRR
jgi:hypothetical protein